MYGLSYDCYVATSGFIYKLNIMYCRALRLLLVNREKLLRMNHERSSERFSPRMLYAMYKRACDTSACIPVQL